MTKKTRAAPRKKPSPAAERNFNAAPWKNVIVSGASVARYARAGVAPGGKQIKGVDLLPAKDVDTARISSWIRQASRLPGYAP